jgi:hypothetical protein
MILAYIAGLFTLPVASVAIGLAAWGYMRAVKAMLRRRM